MTNENGFSKTFEEWYEDWFKKPFPTDKEEAEGLKADSDLQSAYEYCCKRKISVEKENKEYEDGYCIGFRTGHNECKKEAKKIIKDLLDLLKNEAYRTRCYEEMQRAEEFIKI